MFMCPGEVGCEEEENKIGPESCPMAGFVTCNGEKTFVTRELAS
jgi:hypothetical protein